MMMLICIKQHRSDIQSYKFMEKLRNTDAKLKKIVSYEKQLNTNYKL